MHTTLIENAKPYQAQGHHDMRMVRLQGREAGPSQSVWIGLSHIAPGGGTDLSAAVSEKFYLVISGELTVSNGSTQVKLKALDSCRIAPGEPRQLMNQADAPAMVLLVMPARELPRILE